jgi:hypothetical protein
MLNQFSSTGFEDDDADDDGNLAVKMQATFGV